MKKLTLISLMLFVGIVAIAQEQAAKKNEVSTEYDRNALTVIVLDNNGKYMSDIKQATSGIIIPSKFDDNMLGVRVLPSSSSPDKIKEELIKNKVPNNILAKWFSRDEETGKMDMTVIHERGMYNATDDDIRQASGSKLGLAKIKDAGEILINSSYILVLKYYNVQDIEKQYDKQDAAKQVLAKRMGTDYTPVKRRKNGWTANVKGYLYRLSFNDSIMDTFYNDLWIYDDDDEATRQAKKEKFEQMNFPVSYIMEFNGRADGTQYNEGEILAPPKQLSKDELFQKLLNTGLTSVLYNIERKVEDFRVKTPLYSVHPLKSKVGKKEGVRTDQRFFVFEFVQNKKGETKADKKGVIRAKKVVDNRQVATGNSNLYTSFYQIAGGHLMEGMLLQQRNDFGFGIGGGVSMGSMGGAFVKVDANLAVLAGRYANMDLGISQLKFFASFGGETKEYTMPGYGTYDMSFSHWQVGISKGWYFARMFSIAPFFSYGIETATNDDWVDDNWYEDGDYIGTSFVNFGASLGVNIAYWLQITGTLNLYGPFGYAFDKDDNEYSGYYTDYFSDRSGSAFDIGLRIEF